MAISQPPLPASPNFTRCQYAPALELAALASQTHSDSAQFAQSRHRPRASAWRGEASEHGRDDRATTASRFRWSTAKAEVRASGGSVRVLEGEPCHRAPERQGDGSGYPQAGEAQRL